MDFSNYISQEEKLAKQLRDLEQERLQTSSLTQIESITHSINSIKTKRADLRITHFEASQKCNYKIKNLFDIFDINPLALTLLNSFGDELPKQTMHKADLNSFVYDGVAQLIASPNYKGWIESDIDIKHTKSTWKLPTVLEKERNIQYRKLQTGNYTNDSLYRLNSLEYNSLDTSKLTLNFSEINFFDYYSVYKIIHSSFIVKPNSPITPMEQYGAEILISLNKKNKITSPLPNIINVQCILITSDKKIVCAKRSNTATFLPGHWSASFEETMEVKDANFQEAAKRGAYEEFGDSIGDNIIESKILSINFEYHSMAITPFCLIKISKDSTEVKKSWQTAKDRDEASALDFISLELETTLSKLFDNRLWHLSSRKRILECLFNQFGVEETVKGYYKVFASV